MRKLHTFVPCSYFNYYTLVYLLIFERLALHAGKQSEQQLALSGIIGLYKLVKTAKGPLMKYFNKEQAVEVFELFTDALIRYESYFG